MEEKKKITEIKETYTVKARLRGDAVAEDGSKFENKTMVRFKEVAYVEGWARFGHYILDLLIYYVFTIIFGIVLGLILVLCGVDVQVLFAENNYADIINRLLSWLILYPGYYILFESSMQTSPGKLIMKRVVVNEYGEKPSLSTIIKRSYSRSVPFEGLSCLSTLGWHDKWSDTFVIRKKDLEELKLAMKVQEIE